MKSVRGPGGWIRGFVMNQMKYFEKFGVMHGPMCPVKVGIMQENH